MDIREFCKKYNLFTDFDSFQNQIETFLKEMEIGLGNNLGSLKMIPAYISLDNAPIAKNRKVIVIDAGGTNLRIALVNFDDTGTPIVEEFNTHPMLGMDKEITIDEFFIGLAEYLEPIAEKSAQIGFCFSFPCEILPNLDGKVILFNKEIKIRDSKGAILGEGLRKALKDKGLPYNHRVVVINDTVATLLGGKAFSQGRNHDSYIGYILGTGTNTCYIENNKKILKSVILKDKECFSFINMESGGYDKIPRNSIDKAFDSKLGAPDTQLLEKMISGAYQGMMLTSYIQQAAKEGYFEKRFAEMEAVESKEIDEFLYYPDGNNKLARHFEHSKDKTQLFNLIDSFFERAAAVTVVNLAAVMIKANIGSNPLKPVCITAEGSTFYKSKLLNEKVNYYMIEYVQKKLGIYSEFKKVENVTIIGTAFSALLG